MGKLTKPQARRLEAFLMHFADRMDRLGPPTGGSHVIDKYQELVMEYMEDRMTEADENEKTRTTFMTNTYSFIWKRLSELILSKYPELDGVRYGKKADARNWDSEDTRVRLFERDSMGRPNELYLKAASWRKVSNDRHKDERETRENYPFQWGEIEYDLLYPIVRRCLDGTLKSGRGSDLDRCIELIFAISFITGRRAWEETGRITSFHEVEPPNTLDRDHADDWIHAKHLSKGSPDMTLPIFNFSAVEVIKAWNVLRSIEKTKSWYSDVLASDNSGNATLSSKVYGPLTKSWGLFVENIVLPCFERCFDSGYDFSHNPSGNFTGHDLRRMYASYGFWRHNRWCDELADDGKPNAARSYNASDYTREVLGHAVSSRNSATKAYLAFQYVGEKPLEQRAERAGVFNKRVAV